MLMVVQSALSKYEINNKTIKRKTIYGNTIKEYYSPKNGVYSISIEIFVKYPQIFDILEEFKNEIENERIDISIQRFCFTMNGNNEGSGYIIFTINFDFSDLVSRLSDSMHFVASNVHRINTFVLNLEKRCWIENFFR